MWRMTLYINLSPESLNDFSVSDEAEFHILKWTYPVISQNPFGTAQTRSEAIQLQSQSEAHLMKEAGYIQTVCIKTFGS